MMGLQSLRHQPQPRLVPVDDLQPSALLVGEREQRTAAHISLELLAHRRIQPFKAFAHVDGIKRHEHLQTAGEA